MHERLIERFRRARSDPQLVVLEGFHALKHALRFGAEIAAIAIVDVDAFDRLAESLAPELKSWPKAADVVPPAAFHELAPVPPATGVIAIARRPDAPPDHVWSSRVAAPLIFLEAPNDLGNIGAVVRVAAAAGAAGVITTGRHDPWHPTAVRGSAGLHFAIPVARVEELPSPEGRELIAIDPVGDAIRPGDVAGSAMLAFGTERGGLSAALLSRARKRLRIPMQSGISSLNLAASVAVVLYAWRLEPDSEGPHHPRSAVR